MMVKVNESTVVRGLDGKAGEWVQGGRGPGATVHAAQRLGKARTSVNFAMEKCWHRRWVSSLPRASLLLALRSVPFSFDVFCNGKFDH